MARSLREKRFEEGLAAYQELPDRLKKDKSVLILRFGLARGKGDKEYLAALQDMLTNYPDDPWADLLAVDAYLLTKQYSKALESIDRVDQAVGGDPYQKVVRAGIYIATGQVAKAREACEQAIKKDPMLKGAYWRLVDVSLQQKDFAETARLLNLLADRFQVQIKDLTTVPSYAEFVRSPEYKEWLKSREKK